MVALTKRHAVFASILITSAILYGRVLSRLVTYAFSDESYSHIVLIPLISLFLLYTERKKIFSETSSSISAGAGLIVSAVLGFLLATKFLDVQGGEYFLFGATLTLVVLWAGGFLACYGVPAMRAAIFPLLFLLLMVPLPGPILARTISLLQRGSAEIAYLAIKSAGVPVLRQGLYLSVPGLVVEVATECSGIRSSMALLITCLLATHFFLRTPWKQLLFVCLALPLAIVKNGIRIATLVTLGVYVDPGFLRGHLHRDGGFVFFLLILAVLWPVLSFLRRSEDHHESVRRKASEKGEGEVARG
jgi:exosortase